MASVVVCVESDEITVKNTRQERLADGEDAVDLGRWEGGVQEEANLDILLGVANLLAQHLGKEHEVVVVDPNQVAILNIVHNGFGKQAVDFAVGAPCTLVECDFTGVVVEEWPEDGV